MPEKKCQHDIAIETAATAAVGSMREAGITADYDAILRFVASLNHKQRIEMIALIQTMAVAMVATMQMIEMMTDDDSEPDGPPPPFSGRMH